MDVATLVLYAVAAGFVGCLIAIAACDLSRFTIPNAASVALLALFAAAVPFARVDVPILAHLYSFLIVLAVGLVAFRFGAFGGGDVKSWAAVAVWYDVQALPAQVVSVALIGGGLGLLILGLRRAVACQFVQNRVADVRVPRLLRTGEPVPYGVAIAIGTLLTVGHIDVFRSLPF